MRTRRSIFTYCLPIRREYMDRPSGHRVVTPRRDTARGAMATAPSPATMSPDADDVEGVDEVERARYG